MSSEETFDVPLPGGSIRSRVTVTPGRDGCHAVDNITGCTAQGRDLDEVLMRLLAAIDLYYETAKKDTP